MCKLFDYILNYTIMERIKNSVSAINSAVKKVNVDEIIKENLELMYSIQKNRNNFCQLVGGC